MSTLLHDWRPTLPDWVVRCPIAHRGLHDPTRPENTLAAFEAALDARYAIELDVHLSRDGQVVVFHDDTLDRLTPARGPVGDRDAAELGSIAVGGTREIIPTLAQVLACVSDRAPVVVEIKNSGRAGALEPAVCSVLRQYSGRTTIQSFNPWTLGWFRRHAPEFPRGLLASDFKGEALPRHEKVALRNLLLAPYVQPDYVGYDLTCLPYWAPSLLRAVGIPLLAWTIRTPDDLQRARALADNVIFEGVRP